MDGEAELPPLEEDNTAERSRRLASQLGPDPFIGELMKEGNAEFFLIIYTVPMEEYHKQLETLGEIFSFLDKRGKVVGKLCFKAGSTVKFFGVLLDVVGLDLMSLVGSTVEENTHEEELCCGILEWQAANTAVERLTGLDTGDEATIRRFSEAATRAGIDNQWGLQSATALRQWLATACDESKDGRGVIMGLFE